jgi:hypothetical protein
MTPDDFRKLALALPEAIEGSHMDHPDFRVGGKIFATIAPDGERGMAKLKPDQQAAFLRSDPKIFEPAAGAWGKGGSTMIHLKRARKAVVEEALMMAWRNTAPKRLSKQFEE